MITPLLLILVAALVMAAFFAPLEALRWWATQGAVEADLTAATLRRIARSTPSPTDTDPHPCYVVYLSGVGAVTAEANPVGEMPMLTEMAERLPAARLISDVYPYSVQNRTLLRGRWSSWWWRLIERFGRHRHTAALQFLVYIRNALQFGVSADDRYGPMYGLGVARVIFDRLLADGYNPALKRPVILLGWSGGAQIALGASWYLAGAGIPVYLLSLGGVITSDPGLGRLRHVWHLKGTRDRVQAIGQLFPGRWPGRQNSHWGRAMAEGRISVHEIGPMRHLGRGSYLSRSTLPDGRTCRRTVVDAITEVIREAGLDKRQT